MTTTTGPQNPPPVPPDVPRPPAPAPAPPLRDVVVVLAVLVVLLAVGAGAYLAYAHPGSRGPLMAGGAVAAVLVMRKVAELTTAIWQGQAHRAGHHTYDGRIPIVVTGLNPLREHGPAGPAFQRIGRPDFQSLKDAIGNPRGEAAIARARAAEARAEAQRTAEREARRPVCADCGAVFTDARWHESRLTGWGRCDYPQLCDPCKRQVVTADEHAREEAAAEAARLPATAPPEPEDDPGPGRGRGWFRRRT